MRKFIIYTILILSFFWSCSGTSVPETETVPVDFSQKTPDHFLDMISRITLLPLEAPDSILIGSNNDLFMVDNEYYVVNPSSNKKIFRFSGDGKFLNTIGRAGRGPGEYADIHNVQIKGDTVIVYSYPEIILNYYDRKGNFIVGKQFSGHSAQIYGLDNNLLVYTGFGMSDPERLYLYEPSSGKKTALLTMDAKVINITERPPVFYPYGGDVFIREMYCDTVYRYDTVKRAVFPYIVFDKGKYGIDKKCFTFDDPFAAGDYFLSKERALTQRYMENEDFRLVEILWNKQPEGDLIYGINRKGEKEWRWFKGGETVYGFFSNSFRLFSGGKLYCIFEPFQIKNITEPIRAKISNPQALDRIGENDNPVIGIITFKSGI